MLHHVEGDGFVLDLFGGSGSTLLACESTRRSALLMELDPKFMDVIVQRWQGMSGKKAILDGDGRTFAEMRAEEKDAVSHRGRAFRALAAELARRQGEATG